MDGSVEENVASGKGAGQLRSCITPLLVGIAFSTQSWMSSEFSGMLFYVQVRFVM